MTVELSGKVTNEKGTDLEGLTVQLYTATAWEAAGSVTSTDTTDSDGLWNFDAVAVGTYIVVVNNSDSTKKVLFDGRNEVQFAEVDIVTRLQVDSLEPHTAAGGLTFGSIEDGASVLVSIFQGNRATMADGDEAYISYRMSDSGGTQEEVARFTWHQLDINPSADGRIEWEVAQAGTLRKWLEVSSSAGGVLTAVFNEDALDWDLRMEGDTAANLFTLDANLDSIGIGAVAADGTIFEITPGAVTRTAVTAVGNGFNVPADTDNFDNASSTVAIYAAEALGIQTLTSDNATLTFTDVASLYIAGIPVASTNVAFTNAAYAIWIDAGPVRLDSAQILTNAGAATVTLPSATDTLVGKATTDILTNKTLDADGTGNVITNIGSSEIKAEIITGLTALATGPAETDEVLISDGGTLKRIDIVELLNPENFTAVTLPAAADALFINDGGLGRKITHDDLLFGANGTPSTQAHSDSAAIGTALDAARSDHKHAMPAAGGGISNVVDDTTPQLGGTLDIQTNVIAGNGGTTGIVISSAGEVNMTSQPAFLAQNSATDDNQTGNGATATVDFDTEIFDQNGDFSADTFTAPVAGRYFIQAQVTLSGMEAAMVRGNIILDTVNRDYERDMQIPEQTNDYSFHCSVIADFDASETATVTVRIFSGSGNNADVLGHATIPFTFFSACLLA